MSHPNNDMVVACAQLVGNTGAEGFQLRYSDDEKPIVWFAVATYRDGRAEVGASLEPGKAAVRLCEQLVDGGTCQHCGNPTCLLPDPADPLPLPGLCAYQYDPELKVFRRSCEGDR